MRIGSIVKLKYACLGNSSETFGIVYEIYSDFEGSGIACSVIFENGEFDGFSVRDQEEFFEYVKDVNFSYTFTNVMKLSKDFDNGVFSKIFEELRN